VIRIFAIALDRPAACGRDAHVRRCYRPAAFPYGCGLHLHEPNFDKIEEFDGGTRNELLVGAAPWRPGK